MDHPLQFLKYMYKRDSTKDIRGNGSFTCMLLWLQTMYFIYECILRWNDIIIPVWMDRGSFFDKYYLNYNLQLINL